jgi:hypothetical protein
MLYKRTNWVNSESIQYVKSIKGTQFIPDGAYNFTNLNDTHLEFGVKVNDLRDLETLRNNGISKTKINRKLINSNWTVQTEYTAYIGILVLTDWITSAFIKDRTQTTL